MRKSGRPKKRIQRKKGTVIIKEFNKQTIYNNKEVIQYYNFFKVETLKFGIFKYCYYIRTS